MKRTTLVFILFHCLSMGVMAEDLVLPQMEDLMYPDGQAGETVAVSVASANLARVAQQKLADKGPRLGRTIHAALLKEASPCPPTGVFLVVSTVLTTRRSLTSMSAEGLRAQGSGLRLSGVHLLHATAEGVRGIDLEGGVEMSTSLDREGMIAHLIELRGSSKFEAEGFYPGAVPEEKEMLSSMLDESIDSLIDLLQDKASGEEVIAQIERDLSLFSMFDTEDRERVAQYYDEMAKAGNLRIADTLNTWLYGFNPNASRDEIEEFFHQFMAMLTEGGAENDELARVFEMVRESEETLKKLREKE